MKFVTRVAANLAAKYLNARPPFARRAIDRLARRIYWSAR
jgi:hypothetical protein